MIAFHVIDASIWKRKKEKKKKIKWRATREVSLKDALTRRTETNKKKKEKRKRIEGKIVHDASTDFPHLTLLTVRSTDISSSPACVLSV